MHESIVSNLHESCGQNVLQIAAYEFHDIQAAGSPPVTFLFFVPEGHGAVFNFHNPGIGYGYFEDIWGQIFEASYPVTNGLAVNIPFNLAAIKGNPANQTLLLDFVQKNGFKKFGQRPDRQVKIPS